MKKRVVSILLSMLVCLMAVPFNMIGFADDNYCPFGGGTGTEADPYKISNAFYLRRLAELVNDEDTTKDYNSAYYIQTADIDLKNEDFTPIGRWLPENVPFKGNYNGNYHKVINLNVNVENYGYAGLFGIIHNGSVANLDVYGNVSDKFDGDWIICGGISGEAAEGTSIKNCSFTGNVSGNKNAVGGIVGQLVRGGEISSCYFNGNVYTETECCGGIVGHMSDHSVICTNKVTNCYAVGTVKAGVKLAGGVVGKTSRNQSDTVYLIDNNYYLDTMADKGIDGFITSGCSKLDADFMKNVNELLGSPFVYNESNELNDGYPVFEWQAVPYQFRGSGSADDPYQISSKEELEKMRDLVNSKFFTEHYSNKCYIQTADIDLENEKWTPIGTRMVNNVDLSAPLFWGSYNGNGHTIKNLYVNETEGNGYSGLFGSHRGNGIIENLIVYGEVKSNSRCVGGIAGEVVNGGGIIRNCAFIGNITGSSNNVGGIAGVIHQNGTIENCYHIGDVSTLTAESERIGGIVGQLLVGDSGSDNTLSIVKNCYNIGKVTGTSNCIGSIVGNMTHREKVDGEIYVENCYAIKGDVSGNISGNYTTNYDVTELSENMMRNVANKLGDAFVKNPDINFNNGYPVFTWQIKANGDINGDGVFNVSDVVILQKWLLADSSVTLENWKNADLCEDNRLDSFDLVMMKKQLIGK